MSRIFLDPDAADHVAEKLLDLDSELLTRAPRIQALLEEACVASHAPQDARHAAEICGTLAMELRTRAALVRDADAQCAPRSVRELLIGGSRDNVRTALGAHDPAAIHRWWNRLPAQQQAWLKQHAREAISGLDGVPADVRDELNRQRINAQITADRAALAVLPRVSSWDERRRELAARIASHQAMLVPDLTVLLYDPTGDGRAAVALGNVTTATHIGVIVPGITNQLDNYPGMLRTARALDAEARLQGSKNHAVIAWLGYDTPEMNLTPAGRARAQQGAHALVPFVSGLRDVNTRGADVTVLGHSYGSLVTGIAAQDSMEADRIVLVGSPGTGSQNVEELGMDPKDVYVARVPDDPIRHVFKSGEAKNYLVGGPVGLLTSKAVGYDPDVHGPDPSLPGFGATPLPYDDQSHGHSAYYAPKSLSAFNHARAMLGEPPLTELPEVRP